MLPSNFMDSAFNILVCSFRFFCINNMNVMILEGFLRMALYTVGIKYQDQDAALDPLIIA